MSGSIKLTYGSFGTGTARCNYSMILTSEADLDIAASSSGGGITMSGTLELTKTWADAGPVTISSGALTFTYDKMTWVRLLLLLVQVPTGGDGEDDSYGDYSIAFLLVVLVFHIQRPRNKR